MAAINVEKMSLKELVALESKLKSAITEARTREGKNFARRWP
jgi:hypothetical protein